MTDSPLTEPFTSDRDVDDEEGDGPRLIAINLSELIAGGEVEGLPQSLQELLEPVLREIVARSMAHELQELITPEVANDILWCYGDFEGTSEPNLATAALVNLIRVAHISDDHIMGHLEEVDHFKGYIMGICALAEEGEKGLHLLRVRAGLVPDDPESKHD